MAPTFEATSEFDNKYKRLSRQEQQQFRAAVRHLVEDLKAKKGFRRALRVKGFKRATGVFEMSWAPNGRALFTIDEEVIKGETHIRWISIGGHEIFERGK